MCHSSVNIAEGPGKPDRSGRKLLISSCTAAYPHPCKVGVKSQKSLIDSADVRELVTEHITVHQNGQIFAKDFCEFVNDKIVHVFAPSRRSGISVRTVRRWLTALDYVTVQWQKMTVFRRS